MTKDKIVQSQIKEYYDLWVQTNNIYRIWSQQNDTTGNEVLILYVIQNNEKGCTQTDIVERSVMPKQTVSVALSNLEKKGLVVRKYLPNNRRVKIIELTEQGLSRASDLLGRMNQWEAKAFSKMPKEKIDVMLETLKEVVGNLSQDVAE